MAHALAQIVVLLTLPRSVPTCVSHRSGLGLSNQDPVGRGCKAPFSCDFQEENQREIDVFPISCLLRTMVCFLMLTREVFFMLR
jgi:hypothetical protein